MKIKLGGAKGRVIGNTQRRRDGRGEGALPQSKRGKKGRGSPLPLLSFLLHLYQFLNVLCPLRVLYKSISGLRTTHSLPAHLISATINDEIAYTEPNRNPMD